MFLQEQWDIHEQRVLRGCRLDWKRVQNCKKALQDLVVHCEDHHPNHLMACCPKILFCQRVSHLGGSACFSRTQKAWATCAFEQIPKQLKSRYPWGVDTSGSLPVGFVLLNRRKMFRKGRTIVSYLHAPLRELLAGTAHATQLMFRTVWQGLDLSIPEIWRRTWRCLSSMMIWRDSLTVFLER